jgi:hypothetical protein
VHALRLFQTHDQTVCLKGITSISFGSMVFSATFHVILIESLLISQKVTAAKVRAVNGERAVNTVLGLGIGTRRQEKGGKQELSEVHGGETLLI